MQGGFNTPSRGMRASGMEGARGQHCPLSGLALRWRHQPNNKTRVNKPDERLWLRTEMSARARRVPCDAAADIYFASLNGASSKCDSPPLAGDSRARRPKKWAARCVAETHCHRFPGVPVMHLLDARFNFPPGDLSSLSRMWLICAWSGIKTAIKLPTFDPVTIRYFDL